MAEESYFAAEVALWFQKGCGNELDFLGCHNMAGVSVPRGDRTPYYCRDGKRTWRVSRTSRGAPGLGTCTLVVPESVTNMVAEQPCPINLYTMLAAEGVDEDLTNYDYLYVFYDYEPNSEDIDMLVAGVDPGDETRVMLSMPGAFTKRIKVKQWLSTERDVSGVTGDDIYSVAYCDETKCLESGGIETPGCDDLLFSSDGVPSVIGQSANGGATWTSNATPFTITHDLIDTIACKENTWIAVNGETSEYAYSWDAGTAWTVVGTFTTVMRDVFMLNGVKMWFAGEGGYIYYSNDRGASVAEQDAGVAADSNTLLKIKFADRNRGYAVGYENTFVYTRDGSTWVAGVGPCIAMPWHDLYSLAVVPGTDIVIVGDSIGNVYRSIDYGQNWTLVFAANAYSAGGVAGIALCDCNVVMIITNTSDPYIYPSPGDGHVFYSIDGTATWAEVDDFPDNTGLRDIVCCDINSYWIVGDGGFVAQVSGPFADC